MMDKVEHSRAAALPPDSGVQQKEMAAAVRYALQCERVRAITSVDDYMEWIVLAVLRKEQSPPTNLRAQHGYAAKRAKYITDRLMQAKILPVLREEMGTSVRARDIKRGIADLLLAGEIGPDWETPVQLTGGSDRPPKEVIKIKDTPT